jgi:hypothetical protein
MTIKEFLRNGLREAKQEYQNQVDAVRLEAFNKIGELRQVYRQKVAQLKLSLPLDFSLSKAAERTKKKQTKKVAQQNYRRKYYLKHKHERKHKPRPSRPKDPVFNNMRLDAIPTDATTFTRDYMDFLLFIEAGGVLQRDQLNESWEVDLKELHKLIEKYSSKTTH